ncbi:MAG: hypothetical protein LUB61_01040 [Eggerthellaceae bacterium]|nr:hypothetical protein [Eggerthellaceae bacterium]
MIYFTADLHLENANELISKLHGKKYLIRGNHDKNYDESLFEEITDFKVITVDKTKLVLMHYPMLSWPDSFHGSIQLHGHIHSGPDYNAQNLENGVRRYDVGVDANKYYPVSVYQVLDFFGARQNEGKHRA